MSDIENFATTVRIRWTAPELLPDADTVATLSWRRSGDSGVEVTPRLLAALGAKKNLPVRFTT